MSSIRLATSSVRSTRVPIGALKLMLNCDSSVSGKNSVPMKRLRDSDAAKNDEDRRPR